MNNIGAVSTLWCLIGMGTGILMGIVATWVWRSIDEEIKGESNKEAYERLYNEALQKIITTRLKIVDVMDALRRDDPQEATLLLIQEGWNNNY